MVFVLIFGFISIALRLVFCSNLSPYAMRSFVDVVISFLISTFVSPSFFMNHKSTLLIVASLHHTSFVVRFSSSSLSLAHSPTHATHAQLQSKREMFFKSEQSSAQSPSAPPPNPPTAAANNGPVSRTPMVRRPGCNAIMQHIQMI